MKYVIKSNNGGGEPRWIADREGDPGRTLILENAKVFNTYESAKRFMLNTIKKIKYRPNLERNLFIEEYNLKEVTKSTDYTS